jgi:diguanylate cyclase (GGDEF)-like protein/PAS domain S-box-containing protein
MSIDNYYFRLLSDYLYDGIYGIDQDRKIIYWNRAAEHITGYSREEVIGIHCWNNVLVHLDADGNSLCETNTCPAVRAMEGNEVEEAKIYLKHKDGHRLPVVTRILPMRDSEGRLIGVMGVFKDISPMVSYQQELESLKRLSLLDPLTEIGNRRYLEIHLQAKLDELSRYDWPFGIIFCDMDSLKQINDTYGHQKGDEVIKMVARTLGNCVRPFDFVGRWGGDEFMAIITKVKDWQLYAIAERLRLLVQESAIKNGSQHIRTTISIGTTVARPGDSEEQLIKRVDQMLYKSKTAEGNRVTMDAQAS